MFLLKKKFRYILFASLIISLITIFSLAVDSVRAISISTGPTVSNLKATTANISWQTNENADSTVYYTAASGPSWHTLNSGTTAGLTGISLLNRKGWAVGQGGAIIYTNDSKNWSAQSSGTLNVLFGVSGVDANTAWICGMSGTILYTTNKGATWSQQVSGTSSILIGISAVDAQNAWAVGTGGIILHTTNGGITWGQQTSGNSSDLLSVSAVDAQNAWVVGVNGTILHTANGGNTWTQQVSGVSSALTGVSAYDSQRAWVVGVNGLILYTSNGGTSWTQQSSNTLNSLYGISASSANNVCAAGAGGTVLCSSNAGSTWNNLSGQTSQTLQKISLAGTNIFSVGSGGTIIFYGLNYDSISYNGTLATSHSSILSGLSPLTKYYYYVCSENSLGQEICSDDQTFTTLAACPDGTDDGQCNASQQYCQGTTLVPASGKNCLHCGVSCSSPTPYCSPTSQICEAKCSDGTNPGSCNATKQYCDPATFQLSNNCSINNARCSFTCPSSDPYCNTGNGSCEKKCSDGTAFGACSAASHQYCLNGSFFPDTSPNCVECSFDCATTPTTPYCDEDDTHACIDRCSDGTAKNECNASKQYCDPTTLTLSSSCSINAAHCFFACPAANPYCNAGNGQCEAKCSDGTARNSCNATKQYCDNSFILHTDCSTNITRCTFTCPSSTPFCDGTNCIARCTDGTQAGQCSSGNRICNPSLQLVQWCNNCGYACPSSAPYCDGITHLCDANKCSDGTAVDSCNVNQQYCDPTSKTLITNCTKCGYTCSGATPYCETNGTCSAKCPDGTAFGQCNASDYYCQGGEFLPADSPNCYVCGYDCSLAPGKPYCDEIDTQACIGRCADGTEPGSCSGTQYCNSTTMTLANDCRQCGYTCPQATPQCNVGTGVCEVDETPPVISNIHIIPNINSAILTFDTNEPATADIAVLMVADCTLLHSVKYVGDLSTSFSVVLDNLASSRTYYLNIGAWDNLDNFAATGCPSSISFTTLAAPDMTAPDVVIIAPVANEDITTPTYTIKVEASDTESGVDHVDLMLREGIIATLTSSPYEYEINCSAYDPGPYFLTATAYDRAGNHASFGEVVFNISFDNRPPIVTDITSNVQTGSNATPSAVITWHTNKAANSRVDFAIENVDGSFDHSYGFNTDENDDNCTHADHCVKNDSLSTDHSITLTGLLINRRYHYQVTSCDQNNNCAH